jgi:SAM-dependent methyltransferase
MNTVVWMTFRSSVKAVVPRRYHHVARQSFGLLAVPLYVGNKVECPCCGSTFRKFLPVGLAGRPNARCPKCGSLERERLLHLYLRERTSIFTDQIRMLHIAPEPALQKLLKSAPNVDYVSADLESPLAMIKMDITDIPYDDNTFDCIICLHVLEHVLDDHTAMRELARVLKPGGFAIVQVPIDVQRAETYEDPTIVIPKERERAFGQDDHVRIYGRDYAERLRAAGFIVQVDNYASAIGEARRQEFGLQEESIYRCSVLPLSAEHQQDSTLLVRGALSLR